MLNTNNGSVQAHKCGSEENKAIEQQRQRKKKKVELKNPFSDSKIFIQNENVREYECQE